MRIFKSVDLEELAALKQRDEFFWLDLNDPDRATLQSVGEVLGLHRLAIEDTQGFGQRPKLDLYDRTALLVYFGATDDGEECLPAPVEVHVHISGGFVITVHREPCRQFELMQETLEQAPPATEQGVVYGVIDALTDSVLDVLERVTSEVDDHESRVFHRPRARDRDRMALLRRELGGLRRALVVQRQVFDRAVERIAALPGLDQDLSTYYRDVGDNLWRAIDEVESARESLQSMLDTYTNEVQERLTIVATIFLPLTVVTGFFGQNFNWMINHIGSAWTFWGLGIGGLVVSALTIALWLMHTGLVHRPGERRAGAPPASDRRPPRRAYTTSRSRPVSSS